MSDALLIIITGLAAGSIYALVAYGFNITYATSGVLNFAQGDLTMLGAMIAYAATRQWEVGVVSALVVALAVGAAINLVVYSVAVRPLKNVGSGYGEGIMWLLSTFGAALVIQSIAALIWGRSPFRVPQLIGEDFIAIGTLRIQSQELVIILSVVVISILLSRFQSKTIVGQAMSAVSFNSRWASLNGIPPEKLVAMSFAGAGAVAGLGGALLAPLTFAHVDMGFGLALKGFTISAIGGIGENRGTLVAALIFGMIESLVAWKVPGFGREAFVYVALTLLLLVRPHGLFGSPVGVRV